MFIVDTCKTPTNGTHYKVSNEGKQLDIAFYDISAAKKMCDQLNDMTNKPQQVKLTSAVESLTPSTRKLTLIVKGTASIELEY